MMEMLLVGLAWIYMVCGIASTLIAFMLGVGGSIVLICGQGPRDFVTIGSFCLFALTACASLLGGYQLGDMQARCRIPLTFVGLVLIGIAIEMEFTRKGSALLMGALGCLTLFAIHNPAATRHFKDSAKPKNDVLQ